MDNCPMDHILSFSVGQIVLKLNNNHVINPKQYNSYQLYIAFPNCPRTTSVKCYPLIVESVE